MKKINIIRKNKDFNRIIKCEQPFRYKDYVVYIERNTNDIYKFGLSVGKRFGNAVIRNKYKRRLKNIIDKQNYQNGFNCIIILGKGIINQSYIEMENNLFHIFKILKLTKEK